MCFEMSSCPLQLLVTFFVSLQSNDLVWPPVIYRHGGRPSRGSLEAPVLLVLDRFDRKDELLSEVFILFSIRAELSKTKSPPRIVSVSSSLSYLSGLTLICVITVARDYRVRSRACRFTHAGELDVSLWQIF